MQNEFVMFAQKAFIVSDGKLLIVQKSKDCINTALKWEVPGGRRQIGENLDDHIKREVMEEVGLEVVPKNVFDMCEFKLPNSVNPVSGNPVNVIVVARECELKGNSDVKITESGFASFKWVQINDDLLKFDFIKELIPIMENFVKTYKK